MIMKHPLVSFGTDALYSTPIPHPRSFHSSVEYLSRYVEKEHVLSLEEAIRKMTGENADKLSLPDRGYIKEGYKADILLLKLDEARLLTIVADAKLLTVGDAGDLGLHSLIERRIEVKTGDKIAAVSPDIGVMS